MFTALVDNSGYSVDTLGQKADKDFSRNWIFRVRSHGSSAGSSSWPSALRDALSSAVLPPERAHFSLHTVPIALSAGTAFSTQTQQYFLLFAIPSLTHSFIPWLKTFLFCKSFPPQPFLLLFRIHYMDSPDCLLLLLSIFRLYFLVFLFYTF